MAQLYFGTTTTATASASSDKWRRTRGDNNENVAGSIKTVDFADVIDANGVIPSGVALQLGGDGYYKPLKADGTNVLAGFISDQGGVDVYGIDESGVSVSIRETIVPKYLPVPAHQALNSTYPTSGAFVYIQE